MNAREHYLHSLEVALGRRGVIGPDRAEIVSHTGAAMDEAFEGLGRTETAEEIEDVFGCVDALADALVRERGMRAGRADEAAERGVASGDDTPRVLGLPVEARIPTAERLASRMWNPAEPRLFMPRSFGLGWDVNFGALAVKLGLMRPDDVEEVPFARVPRTLTAALTWGSAAVLGAAGVATVALASTLPERMPYHFGLHGPDAFASPIAAGAQLLGIPLAIVLLVAVRAFVRPASALARGLAGAASPAIALLGLGVWGNAVSWAMTGEYLLPNAVVVIVPLAVMFVMLLALTRLGLRREWREQGVQ